MLVSQPNAGTMCVLKGVKHKLTKEAQRADIAAREPPKPIGTWSLYSQAGRLLSVIVRCNVNNIHRGRKR